jgi:hypothetical protein
MIQGTRLLWQRLDMPGMDFCLLVGEPPAEGGRVHTAMGTSTGFRDGRPFAVHWGVQWDQDFLPRKLRVDGPDGTVALDQVENGIWQENGTLRADLAGCLDVDLACTPFTNTLAIRRLALAEGAAAEIDVAHVAVPAMAAATVRQRYTRLDASRWRHEGAFGGFSGVLECDADGLVRAYESSFARVDP